jgi:hypothetical protein
MFIFVKHHVYLFFESLKIYHIWNDTYNHFDAQIGKITQSEYFLFCVIIIMSWYRVIFIRLGLAQWTLIWWRHNAYFSAPLRNIFPKKISVEILVNIVTKNPILKCVFQNFYIFAWENKSGGKKNCLCVMSQISIESIQNNTNNFLIKSSDLTQKVNKLHLKYALFERT